MPDRAVAGATPESRTPRYADGLSQSVSRSRRWRMPSLGILRDLAIPGLHVAVLWAFAVTQPLLDLLGGAPEFFVARENSRADILVLALGLTLVPPLLLMVVELVATLISRGLGRIVHLIFVGGLVAAFVLQILKDHPGGSSGLLIPLSLAVGAGAAALYDRTRGFPTLLTVLGPAPLLFALVFLLISPTSKLVLPGEDVQAADVKIPGRTPVVMILFDELSGLALMGSDNNVNRQRFPAFAQLERDATWYRNANTVADFTDRAVPALLTGEFPDEGAAPIAADHPESLFTLLGGKYSFDVTEPVTDVCPSRLCPSEQATRQPLGSRLRELASDLSVVSLHLLLPDDLERRLPAVDRSFGDFKGVGGGGANVGANERGLAALIAFTQRTQLFTEFNERLKRDPGGAHLSFLHVQIPHNPYYNLPNGQRYPETRSLPGLDKPNFASTWRDDSYLTKQARERYILQTQYGDRLLGDALAALRASGQYDKSLVVVMADHGVGFTPGQPHRAVTAGNLPQIASIPLFVKLPGQKRGRVSDANVHSTDVLATMADALDIRLPWSTDGRPADRAGTGGTVTVQPTFSDTDVSMPFPEFVRQRDLLVQEIAADFGRMPGDVYKVVPDNDLLGRDAGSLGASPSRASFELESSGGLRDVNPKGPVVPSMITGVVQDFPAGARMAVVVGGRVATVTVPYDDGGTARFSAFVPPEYFVKGANGIQAFAITGQGAGRRFQALQGGAVDYRISRRGGSEALVDSQGRRYPISRSAVDGAVENASADEADVGAEGWAGNTDPPRAADRVLLFSGDLFLGASVPSNPRPDLEKSYGRGLARAGFKMRAGVRGPSGQPVLVYAIANGRATLLNPPPGS